MNKAKTNRNDWEKYEEGYKRKGVGGKSEGLGMYFSIIIYFKWMCHLYKSFIIEKPKKETKAEGNVKEKNIHTKVGEIYVDKDLRR